MSRLQQRVYFAVTVLAVLPGLTLLSGCEHSSAASTADPSDTASKVTVVTPTRHNIYRLIQQPGYITPYEETPIYSKIAGYVQEITVDKGSQVKKGDPLIKLWVPEMEQDLAAKKAMVTQNQAQIRQSEQALKAAFADVHTAEAVVNEAKAVVNQSEADYQRWTAEYERAQKLLARGVYDKQTMIEAKDQMQQADAGRARSKASQAASEAALIESNAKYAKAQADLEAARAMEQVAEAQMNQSAAWLDYRNIRAPFDGMVTLRNVHTGHFLQSSSSGSTNKAAEPLLVMMRMDVMRVVVQVPEKDAVLVKDGDLARVAFQALPGGVFPNREPSSANEKEFTAYPNKVTLLSWSFDDRARTLSVEIHIPNPRFELRPGMYANVTIRSEVANALTLPNEAVLDSTLDSGSPHYCFMVVDGKAVRLPVQVGISTEKVVQVLQKQVRTESGESIWEDFTGNEAIVSTFRSLIDGQEVVVEQSPKSGHASKGKVTTRRRTAEVSMQGPKPTPNARLKADAAGDGT
jgi:HlyD family secretion protein